MTEQRSSISKELREAFREAIEKYGDWRYGEPEPEGQLEPAAHCDQLDLRVREHLR
jgi:hypothetical protein